MHKLHRLHTYVLFANNQVSKLYYLWCIFGVL